VEVLTALFHGGRLEKGDAGQSKAEGLVANLGGTLLLCLHEKRKVQGGTHARGDRESRGFEFT